MRELEVDGRWTKTEWSLACPTTHAALCPCLEHECQRVNRDPLALRRVELLPPNLGLNGAESALLGHASDTSRGDSGASGALLVEVVVVVLLLLCPQRGKACLVWRMGRKGEG